MLLIDLTSARKGINSIIDRKGSLVFNYKMLDEKTQKNIKKGLNVATVSALIVLLNDLSILGNIISLKSIQCLISEGEAITGLGTNLSEAVEIGLGSVVVKGIVGL